MLVKIAKLPVRVLRRLVRAVTGGDDTAPAPARPAPAAPAAPRARYAVDDAPAGGHDHSHSHDHGHDHGHSHAHEPEPEPETDPDHGHSHAHGAAPPAVSFEATPNPNAMKFVVSGRLVVEQGSLIWGSAEEAADHPLGQALFSIPGVVSVFAVNDFVTITKDAAAPWGQLTHPIVEAIQRALG